MFSIKSWGDWSGEGFITKAVNDLTYYYLKTEIDTLSKLETLYIKDIIDSDELAALKFTDLADTPVNMGRSNCIGSIGYSTYINVTQIDIINFISLSKWYVN